MTEPYYRDESVTLYHGDCLDVLATLPDASVDAVVTDPPYGLEFMGKEWDSFKSDKRGVTRTTGIPAVPGVRGEWSSGRPQAYDAGVPFQSWCEAWSRECLRVLKPGGHMLAFGGSRTWHRLASAVEDAGFEIRDSIAWLYGSGFPKSRDVARAIDSEAGAVSHRVAYIAPDGKGRGGNVRNWQADMNDATTAPERVEGDTRSVHVPTTDAARNWQGWGTALKPAHEPIVVARKPLAGTVAGNVLVHGTGALNIDGCRVGGGGKLVRPAIRRDDNDVLGKGLGVGSQIEPSGRWPTNVVLDDTQAAALDAQSGTLTSGSLSPGHRQGQGRHTTEGGYVGGGVIQRDYGGDAGGASRFFPTFRYEAKAPTAERPRDGDTAHPTVKPLDLMRWLVRLVTPPGGLVLDPFLGSGTTAEACILEGFRCIGIEREPAYLPLAVARLSKPLQIGLDFGESA